ESQFGNYSRNAITTQIKEQHAMIANFGEDIANKFAMDAMDAPDQIDNLLELANGEIDKIVLGLSSTDEKEYRRNIKGRIVDASITSLLNNGQWKTVKKMLSSDSYKQFLQSSNYLTLQKDLAVGEAREKETKERIARTTANIAAAADRNLTPSEVSMISNMSEKKDWTVFDDINAFTLINGSITEEQRSSIISKSVMKPALQKTDAKTYANDKVTIYKADHPDASDSDIAKIRSDALISYRRAQDKEVYATTMAKRDAEVETAKDLMFNTQLGTRLATIETEAQLIKAQGKETPVELKNMAKGQMSGYLASMGQLYVDLDSVGGVLNIDNGTFENISAALSSSTVGQEAGRIFGTEAQSIRNKINALKPLIINAMRQSSGMGARGLDSENELKFYLAAATNEKKDIQSNAAAIIAMDEAYGSGEVAKELRKKIPSSLVDPLRERGKQVFETGGAFVGIDSQNRIITEEIIKFNMDRYGMTRDEVIDKAGIR
ncbi:MAG: hypothetical protein U9N86_07485, partial [Bacteroidota bacterium]|nr:hypothetical protein [Bacteroidota bacterium]